MPRVADCGVRSCQETSIGSIHTTTPPQQCGNAKRRKKALLRVLCVLLFWQFSGTSLLKRNTRERESIIDHGCSFLCLCQKLYRINREFGGWRRFGSTIEEIWQGCSRRSHQVCRQSGFPMTMPAFNAWSWSIKPRSSAV